MNATASSIDAITVHTADVVAASVGLRMATDTPARGRGGWQMRTWDLHKAYKNLALCPEALEDSYLAVYNPASRRCELYKQYVLPFGARSSVHAFCRTSLGIWKIIVALFGIHICVYFDDYICMEEVALAKLTEKCVEIIFALLGWETADDKDNVFSYSSKVLGLEIDLRDAKLGYAAMRNTPARTSELRDSISEILEAGFLARKDGERLRGRLQFASNQIAGRQAGSAFKQLSAFIGGGGGRLHDSVTSALLHLRDIMLESRPRRIDGNITSVFHLFVDAAHETTWSGLGGVLINERGNPVGYFSEEITGSTLGEFKAKSENPIFEMECFAIYCGVILWSRLIQGCNVVVYTDNQGTLSCMIKGHSENQLGNVIVNAVHRASDECSCNCWYERVNTASNIADAPSRGETSSNLGHRLSLNLCEVFRSVAGG